MIRERALKAVLILVGLLFSAGVYPLTMFLSREPALAMMLSLYVTLGIFLLLAVRNPSANRSLIAFPDCELASRWHEARWSNRFGHCPHCGESVISSWVLAVRRTCNDTQGRPTPAFKFVALRR